MIGVPKKNDLFLKDYKGQFFIFKMLHYHSCNGLFYTNRENDVLLS
jgi:hypothetical protein